MPGATVPLPEAEASKTGKSGSFGKEEPKNMVRTDSKEQKLDKFLRRARFVQFFASSVSVVKPS